jgi:hypothetical protein
VKDVWESELPDSRPPPIPCLTKVQLILSAWLKGRAQLKVFKGHLTSCRHLQTSFPSHFPIRLPHSTCPVLFINQRSSYLLQSCHLTYSLILPTTMSLYEAEQKPESNKTATLSLKEMQRAWDTDQVGPESRKLCAPMMSRKLK